jgi:phosphoenolpyruvate carboxykinase (ATP)
LRQISAILRKIERPTIFFIKPPPHHMANFGIKNPAAELEQYGIRGVKNAFWNLSPEALIEETIKRGQGVLADSGALCIKTGKFTGRSPKDRFIVRDNLTEKDVNWGDVNLGFEPKKFDALYRKVAAYLRKKEVFVRDVTACASIEERFQLSVRVITEYSWSNLFVSNMFIDVPADKIGSFEPTWRVVCAPGFEADPAIDGTSNPNFAIVNFKKKILLIGGTGYTGEIKKGIFSVINFALPVRAKAALPMHCSANVGKNNDVALFFGLSGTGKTTLSADPHRGLIGDDEHAWTDKEVFNFEGGCYAKTIDLTEEKEPDIWRAIRHGALLENIEFFPNTRTVDFSSKKITENTRVSYPIEHIENAVLPSRAGQPQNVFFLTCDAFGVLPPISKLTEAQAMYYFISGYTARVAGTEMGITEPKTTFSACFGAPFLPLHPARYAELLGSKMRKTKVNIWLLNTGWSGGGYGVGSRIKLKFTRAMITAVLSGELDKGDFEMHPIFGLPMPKNCPDVPSEMLNPRNTWSDKAAYDAKADQLAGFFENNFEKYASQCAPEVVDAGPKQRKK